MDMRLGGCHAIPTENRSRPDRDRGVVVRAYVSPFAICRCGRGGRHAATRPFCPGHGAARSRAQLAAHSFEPDDVSTPQPEPLRLPNSALEPIDWNALDGWAADDHAAAFATFLASCRPLLRTILPQGETRPMYFALTHVCRRALAAGRLSEEQARMFFEHNFRPLRITKLGDSAGFLTGYYEPIVDGSRFPTGIFKVPIYRRPRIWCRR